MIPVDIADLADEFGCTEVNAINFSYLWVIKKYSEFSEALSNEIVLKSPNFKAHSDDKISFYVAMSLSTFDKETLTLSLWTSNLYPFHADKLVVKSQWYAVKDKQKCLIHSGHGYCTLTSTNASYAVNVKKSTLNTYLDQEPLTLVIDICMFDIQHTKPADDIENIPVPQCNLPDNFGKMLETGDFSDVTLSIKGEQIKAHKFLLAARSNVFKAMFEHSLKESETGLVNVEEIDVDTVKHMLQFMYTGNVPELSVDVAMGLLAAGDRYALDDLKVICEKFLGKSLEVDNIMQVLVLADLHSAEKLKRCCLEFIKHNSLKVVGTDSWNEVINSRPHLATELCQVVLKIGKCK